ncbi:MAG: lysozyme [Rhizobacter sp.]
MANVKHVRLAVSALSVSLAAFVGLVAHESYTDEAVIPTKNDRPTVGFGSTFRDDGSPVQMGDTITPPKAVARSAAHIAKDEAGLKRCVTGNLSQAEYDILVDFTYQYGVATTCSSSMVREINAGNYVAACNAYTLYKRSGGFDCSIPGNKVCAGVWKRSLERQTKCLSAQ